MANLKQTATRALDKVQAKADSARDAVAGKTVKDKAVDAATPSPNPMTNMILADIALRSGGALLRRAVETGLLGAAIGKAGKKAAAKTKAGKVIKGRSMTQTLVGTAIARIATRSVPGAIVVGGGLLAKTLYDRRKGKQAAKDGAKALDEQARKG